MTGGFQLTKCLEASALLFLTTGVIESKLLAYKCGQSASVKGLVALKDTANVFNAGRLRQGPFDLVLFVHAVRMHGSTSNVQ
jgi:hypothetical protein